MLSSSLEKYADYLRELWACQSSLGKAKLIAMIKKTLLTGVKPTGMPHIGNYLGAIRPALQLSHQPQYQALLFIADYHSLTHVHRAEELRSMTYEVAASWLACGLNPDQSLFYRQSDIPEIFELSWILSCFSPKGLLNRAHAYKAKLQENQEAGRSDPDYGVNMGLFTYPLLMAADILMFSADQVPVGEDQVQHLEIARDIAQKFNNNYGPLLKVPEFLVQKDSKLVPGLDGRKMSKSYGNHIPLFLPAPKLRKLVMKIKTDSSPPEAPKDPNDSLIFSLFKEFASMEETEALAAHYRRGISWGEAKEALFQAMDKVLAEPRRHYEELMADTQTMDCLLEQGAQRARAIARPQLDELRRAIGLGAMV